MRKLSRLILVLPIALLPGLSSSLRAAPSPSFGTDEVSTAVVTAWDFVPGDSATTWSSTPGLGRYQTSAGLFYASVRLPQGALILSIELDACDVSASGFVEVNLYRGRPDGGFDTLAALDTGLAAVPECMRFVSDLATPETVENNTYRYVLGVVNTPFANTVVYSAVRVRYKLQVSPAPGVATFTDVPTSDPAFQFVEALAASGITAGCGGGNYCPNLPLTRRQMAVFLAKALGLHWPDGPAF